MSLLPVLSFSWEGPSGDTSRGTRTEIRGCRNKWKRNEAKAGQIKKSRCISLFQITLKAMQAETWWGGACWQAGWRPHCLPGHSQSSAPGTSGDTAGPYGGCRNLACGSDKLKSSGFSRRPHCSCLSSMLRFLHHLVIQCLFQIKLIWPALHQPVCKYTYTVLALPDLIQEQLWSHS